MSTKKPVSPADRLSEGSAKTTAPNDCFVFILYGGGAWSKGRSVEHAIENFPNYKANINVTLTGVFCPSGCYIHPNSADGFADVWIDDSGSLHVPTGSKTFKLSEDTVQFRKISKSKVKT